MALDNTPAMTALSLTVDAPALKKALALSALAVCKRGAKNIPVLGGALCNVSPGKLTLTTTDLDMSLTVTIPADTADHGQAVFNVADVAGALTGAKGKAAMTLDGAKMALTVDGATVERKDNAPVSDFPVMTPTLYQTRCTIPAADLLSALSACIPAMSSEETRYYLRGIYFHGWQNNKADATLRLVSTDGHRMAIYDLPQPWPHKTERDERGGIILPQLAATVLARLVKESKGADIEIATDHRHALKLHFSGPGWQLETRVVDGSFPDYTRVIPAADSDIRVHLTAKELPKAPRPSEKMVLKFDAESGKMSWGGNDIPEGQREVKIDGAGAVGFNCRYLTDFAAIAPAGFTLEAFTNGNPARFLTQDKRFLGIVMPMRV